MAECRIIQGNCLEILRTLEAESVQCVVTSPPYYGLRDYLAEPQIWNDINFPCKVIPCDKHKWGELLPKGGRKKRLEDSDPKQSKSGIAESFALSHEGNFCIYCNAWRGSLGLEPTPELYVQHLVEIFREVRHVLRADGVLFLNLGDSFSSGLQSSQKLYILREDLITEELLYVSLEIQKQMPGLWRTSGFEEGNGFMSEVLSQEIQTETFETFKRTSTELLSSQSKEVYGKNQKTMEAKERTSNSANGSEMRLLWGNGKNVPLSRSHQRRWSKRLFKEGWATGSLEKSDQRRSAKREVSSSLLELQRSIRLLRFLHSLKLNFSDIPQQIKVFFRPKISLKPKDLIGIPWRVAFALQDDGWYLRQDIIWSKSNCMPESVTDRCTKSHEYIFLFSKNQKYYYDAVAIKEPSVTFEHRPDGIVRDREWNYNSKQRLMRKYKNIKTNMSERGITRTTEGLNLKTQQEKTKATRNKRSVWTITTEPYPEAHFAVFPSKLIEPCILAGTSEKGCCLKCGAPWERIVEKKMPSLRKVKTSGPHEKHGLFGKFRFDDSIETKTIGWRPACCCGTEHPIPETELEANPSLIDDFEIEPFAPVPCIVLDPFCGSGTAGVVALQHRRSFIGIELNPEYIKLAQKRIDGIQIKLAI